MWVIHPVSGAHCWGSGDTDGGLKGNRKSKSTDGGENGTGGMSGNGIKGQLIRQPQDPCAHRGLVKSIVGAFVMLIIG